MFHAKRVLLFVELSSVSFGRETLGETELFLSCNAGAIASQNRVKGFRDTFSDFALTRLLSIILNMSSTFFRFLVLSRII